MSTTAAQDEIDALFASRDFHLRTHPEDAASDSSNPPSDDEAANAHFSDEDRDPSAASHSKNMPSSVYHIPNSTTFDANTGPKGVIADAKSFDRARKRGFRQTLYAFSESVFDKYKSPSPPAVTMTESNSSHDSSADEDDDFMREWRAKRMTELSSVNRQERRTRRQSPSKRRYGYMTTVDAIGYLDAVEKVAADTMVVVCIFDEESAVSRLIEDALVSLSRKHEFTRFVKLSYEEAEMDLVSTPAILAYQSGELVANLVSVIDDFQLGEDVNPSTLESLLKRHQILF